MHRLVKEGLWYAGSCCNIYVASSPIGRLLPMFSGLMMTLPDVLYLYDFGSLIWIGLVPRNLRRLLILILDENHDEVLCL